MTQETAPDAFEAQLRPLWLAALQGDPQAYEQALACIASRVRAFLRRRMANMPDDVEDLVQETLLALHLQRATYDPGQPVSHWVHAIARYKLIDAWRRRGRQAALFQPFDDEQELLAEAAADEGPVRRDLEVLLDALPEAQRTAIVLTKIEGLSVAEAADRTGASASAIKVQVHRGLKRLASLIQRTATP